MTVSDRIRVILSAGPADLRALWDGVPTSPRKNVTRSVANMRDRGEVVQKGSLYVGQNLKPIGKSSEFTIDALMEAWPLGKIAARKT